VSGSRSMGAAGGSPYSERQLTAVIEARERGDVDFLVARLSDTNHNVRRLAAFGYERCRAGHAVLEAGGNSFPLIGTRNVR
jgi:hypothetical protein